MSPPLRILILEDQPSDAELIVRELRKSGLDFRWTVVEREADYLRELDGRPDAVLSDYNLPRYDALRALGAFRERGLDVPFIIVTASISEEVAVECMKAGATDYLVKDRLSRLGPSLRQFLEFHRIRRAKEHAENLYRQIVETSQEGIWTLDPEGRTTYVNRQMAQILGYEVEELLGRNATEFIPSDEWEDHFARLALRREGISERYERRFIHKDGREVTLLVSGSPVLGHRGEHVGSFGMFLDITEQKRTEEALRRSEEENRAIVEAVPDLLFKLDRHGVILDCRPKKNFELLAAPESFLGKPLSAVLPPHVSVPAMETLTGALTSPGIPAFEYDLDTGGARKSFECRMVPLSESAVLAVIRDITERKRAEDAVQESESRFRHISSTISDIAYSCSAGEDGSFALDWMTGAMERITGYTVEEVMPGGCWRFLVLEEDRPLFERNIAGLSPGLSASCELRLKHKNGAIIWVASFAECVQEQEAPHRTKLYGALLDITQRKHTEEALRRKEQQFEALVENSPFGLALIEPDGGWRYVNPKFTEITGYTSGEVPTGRAWFHAAFPDENLRREAVGAWKSDIRDLGPGTRLPRDFPVRRKDGGTRILTITTNSLVTGDFLLSFQDITDRVLAQDALRASETRFRTLFESARDCIFIKDREGRYQLANAAAAGLLGRPPGALDGATDADLFGAAEAPRIAEQDRRALDGETVEVIEDRAVHGIVRTFHLIKVPLRDDSGAIQGLFGIARDITDWQIAQRALLESEASYRGLIEHSVIGFYRGTPDGRIITANPALLAILGYASERELQERQMEETGFRPAFERQELIAALRATGKALGYESRWKRADGTVVHLRESVRALYGDDARIAFVEGFVEDITHLKELEEQFLQAQKMEALGRLAGGIAHDFNNVLMAMMSYSDLMLRAIPPDDPLALYGREIRNAAERAADLTGKLLAFSRRQVVQSRPILINRVIQESLSMLRPLIMEDVEVSIRLQPDLPAIMADANQILQVLTNLAVNARDAMPHGGVLALVTRAIHIGPEGDPDFPDQRPGPYVLLSVGDTGCGMSEEVKKRAFEPFFTTKEKGKGTGLGLSTCFGIIRQFGGSILLDSEPGQGTRVAILFPPCPEPSEREIPPPDAPPLPPPRPRGTVLLVEDEQAVRTVLTEVLTMNGYTVIGAMNAEEALRKAEAAPLVDCLITDVVMPLMSGPELVARLIGRRPDLKVILISGHAAEDLPDRYDERGYKFLQKPFTSDTLIRLIQEMLIRKAT